MHPRQASAPRRDADPDATDDDDRLRTEKSKQTRAAGIVVWPEEESDTDGSNQNQSRSNADESCALSSTFLGPPFLFALELLVRERRLRRQTVEFARYFF